MDIKTFHKNVQVYKKGDIVFIDVIEPNENDFVDALEYISKEYEQSIIFSTVNMKCSQLKKILKLLAKYNFHSPEVHCKTIPHFILLQKDNTVFNKPIDKYDVTLAKILSVVNNYDSLINHSQNSCKLSFKLSEHAIYVLKKMVGYIRVGKSQKEFTGYFSVERIVFDKTPIFVLDIKEKNVQIGDKEEVEGADRPMTFHTHPREAYEKYKVEIAWPSKSDYMTIYEIVVNLSGIFHILAGIEGIYIVSLKKENLVNIKELQKKSEKYIKDISKKSTERKKQHPLSYQMSLKNDPSVPFDVIYYEWENAEKPFHIYTQIIHNKNKSVSCKVF